MKRNTLLPSVFTKGILMTVVLMFAGTLFAQEDEEKKEKKKKYDYIDYNDVKDDPNYGRFRHIEVRGHAGTHLYTGSVETASLLENGFGSLEARFGWQPTGKDHWAAQYGYPSYGFGAYAGFVGDPEVFGNPNAVFGFINFPISSYRHKNVFSIEPAVGLAYNLTPFDPETNPLNEAISARIAFYFNLSFGFQYRMSRELDINYGLALTHFSNGRTYTPNYGLNMFGVYLAMRYHYNADQKKVNSDPHNTGELLQARFERPKREKNYKIRESSINIYGAIGTVQNEVPLDGDEAPERFSTYSVVLDYAYQFDNMHGISAGFDYFYDGSLEKSPEAEGEKDLIGFHVGYSFSFWKLSIQVQPGFYITDDLGKGSSFIRPALRYDIVKWAFAQVGLKTTDGFAADWVEFGIGFKPFRF